MITNKICRITHRSFLIVELTLKTSNNFDAVAKKIIFSYTFSSKDGSPCFDCGVVTPITLTDKNLSEISGVVNEILKYHFGKLKNRKLERYDDQKARRQIRCFYDAAEESISNECVSSNSLTLLHRALSWPEKIVKEYYNELASLV